MAADKKAVRLALRSVLHIVSGLPVEAKRAYEERSFTPPTVDPSDPSLSLWVRERLYPVGELPAAFGELMFYGYVQYDVVFPKGLGTELAETLSKAIKAAFKPGLGIVSSGVEVIIEKSEEAAIIGIDEQWSSIPVRVDWRNHSLVT